MHHKNSVFCHVTFYIWKVVQAECSQAWVSGVRHFDTLAIGFLKQQTITWPHNECTLCPEMNIKGMYASMNACMHTLSTHELMCICVHCMHLHMYVSIKTLALYAQWQTINVVSQVKGVWLPALPDSM